MADASLFRNELLCFIQNNFASTARSCLTTCLKGFYDAEEISRAKSSLFDVAKSLNVDGLPRLKSRKGDNKAASDVDDILQLFEVLDSRQLTMPVFVAADLKRMPSLDPSSVDVCSLAMIVDELRRQLVTVTARLDQMCAEGGGVAVPAAIGLRPSAAVQSDWPSLVPTDVTASPLVAPPVTVSPGPAGAGAYSSALVQGQPKLPPSARKIRVTGKKSVSGSDGKHIVGVQRRLTAIARRLHESTTEQDMLEWMNNMGLTDARCKNLVPKDGQKFSTAAFRVSCAESSKDIFYNEDCWPLGCELRDWVFYDRKPPPGDSVNPVVE